jgi:hypothetical protein
MAERKHVVEINLSGISDSLTVGELIAIQEGDIKTIRDVMGRHMVKDGKPLEPGAGVVILNKMTLTQFKEFVAAFREGIDDDAIPPTNAGGSE